MCFPIIIKKNKKSNLLVLSYIRIIVTNNIHLQKLLKNSILKYSSYLYFNIIKHNKTIAILIANKKTNKIKKNILIYNTNETSLILLAIQLEIYSLVDELINLGISINTKLSNGNSILHILSSYKDIKYNVLSEYNLNINIINNKSETPMHIALKENNIDMINMLLQTSLGNLDYLYFPSYSRYLSILDKEENTCFHCLMMSNFLYSNIILILKYFKLIINNKNKIQHIINIQNKNGNTILHLLLMKRESNEDVKYLIQSLLEDGANITLKNNEGNTPFEYSTYMTEYLLSFARSDILNINELYLYIQILMKYSVDINPNIFDRIDVNNKYNNKDTLLHIIFKEIKTSNITSIIENCNNIDYSICDSKGDTYLHLAIQNRSCIHLIDFLISRININIQNNNGNTILHYMVLYASELINTQPLIKQLINIQNSTGYTPLHCSVLMNRIDILDLLLNLSPNINIQCKNGNTPLHLTMFINNIEIKNKLLYYTTTKDNIYLHTHKIKNKESKIYLDYG